LNKKIDKNLITKNKDNSSGLSEKYYFYVIAGLTRNLKYQKKIEMPDQVRHDGIRVNLRTAPLTIIYKEEISFEN